MKTKILTMADMTEAARLIQAGEVVGFQTETVYGLGADARSDAAVKKIYAAKGRQADNPLIVHVASVAQAERYTENIPEEAYQLMDAFWPGPLTLILPVKKGSLSTVVTAGQDTVGIRFPRTEAAIALIRQSDCPIAAPSANTSGKPSPTKAEHVKHDLDGKIAAIIDTGQTDVGVESTVIDVSNPSNGFTILRPGGVAKEAIEKIIGPVQVSKGVKDASEIPKAPGMKYTHYSPKEPVYIVTANRLGFEGAAAEFSGKRLGLLADDDKIAAYGEQFAYHFSLGAADDVEQATQNLFAGLRYFDELDDVDVILAQAYDSRGIGLAYMNRLDKSAGGKYL